MLTRAWFIPRKEIVYSFANEKKITNVLKKKTPPGAAKGPSARTPGIFNKRTKPPEKK